MVAPLRPRRPLNRPQRGQTIVLFALASLMLMAMLGLAIDAGYDYVQRRLMQSAADAAAQAGAKALHQKKSGPEIEAEALKAATQNGYPGDATNFRCYFIYQDYQTTLSPTSTTCGATTVSNASTFAGVQVRIKERHGTFVMRAIGITETGTAAISSAQVQILATVDMANAPFIVCGYRARLKDHSYSGMLDYSSGTPHIESGYDTTKGVVYYDDSPMGTVALSSSGFANGWDWTSGQRPPDGNMLSPADNNAIFYLWSKTSNYTLSGSQTLPGTKSLCNAEDGFRGAIADNTRFDPAIPHSYSLYPQGLLPAPAVPGDVVLPLSTSGTAPLGPTKQIQGPLGCPKDVMDKCVLILPIADLADLPTAPAWSSPAPSATPAPSPLPVPYATALRVRAWGAFWVTHVTAGATDDYYGQLIKYYPMQGNGWPAWSRNLDFTGPVVVHLIR